MKEHATKAYAVFITVDAGSLSEEERAVFNEVAMMHRDLDWDLYMIADPMDEYSMK